MGSASVYQRLRGTCFSRRFGRWEPGPVGGMGVGFGEGALTKLLGGAGVSILSARLAFASRRVFLQQVLSLGLYACTASRPKAEAPGVTQ